MIPQRPLRSTSRFPAAILHGVFAAAILFHPTGYSVTLCASSTVLADSIVSTDGQTHVARSSPKPEPAGSTENSRARGATQAPRGEPDPETCIGSAKRALIKKEKVDPSIAEQAYAALRGCLYDLLNASRDADARAVASAANELFPLEPMSGFDYGAVLLIAGGDAATARSILEAAPKRPGRYTRTNAADRALGLANLARFAMARGDATSARTLFRQAVEIDPSNIDLLYDLAASEQKAGDAAGSLAHAKEAFSRAPASATRDDYLVASWGYARAGQLADAASLLRQGIAALPNEPGLHLALGYTLAQDGKPADALLEYFYEFENGSSEEPYAKEARRQFADGLGRAKATPKHSEAILELQAAVSDLEEDPVAVRSHLDKLGQLGYKHTTLDLIRAEALAAAGDTQGAEEGLRRILASDAAFLPAYYDLSVILKASGRPEEARKWVAEAAKRNPTHWQLLGDAPVPDR